MQSLFIILFLSAAIMCCNTQEDSKNSSQKNNKTYLPNKFNSIVSEDTAIQLLNEKIRMADSIILASHSALKHFPDTMLPTLMLKGKPNWQVIKEYKVIQHSSIDSLIFILSQPNDSSRIRSMKCFFPHHTIFIIKKSDVSYIDICFDCLGFSISDNLKRPKQFDTTKYTALSSFFKLHGFKYKMK